MWPSSPSAPERPLPTGTLLGIDWSTEELRTLGENLLKSADSTAWPHGASTLMRVLGVDPSRADEIAAAYRLGGTAGLAQALEAARVKP